MVGACARRSPSHAEGAVICVGCGCADVVNVAVGVSGC